MSRLASDWEARLICEMERIARMLDEHSSGEIQLGSELPEQTETFVASSPHPDLVRAYIHLYGILSSYDQRSLYCCILATVYVRNANIWDTLRTGASLLHYTLVSGENEPGKPRFVDYVAVVLNLAVVQWETSTKGSSDMERYCLLDYIPSGK